MGEKRMTRSTEKTISISLFAASYTVCFLTSVYDIPTLGAHVTFRPDFQQIF